MWAALSLTSPHTTNCCESFHSKFNAEFNAPHPSIYAFVEVLKGIPTLTYLRLRTQITRPMKDEIVKREMVEAAREEYTQGKINIMRYLKRVSFKFLPVPI